MKCTSGGTCLSRFSNAEDARGLSLFVARKMPGLIQMRLFSSPARLYGASPLARNVPLEIQLGGRIIRGGMIRLLFTSRTSRFKKSHK